MKRPVLTTFIVLFSLSLAALGYTMMNIGTFKERGTEESASDKQLAQVEEKSEAKETDEDDWKERVRGYSHDDEKEIEKEDNKEAEETIDDNSATNDTEEDRIEDNKTNGDAENTDEQNASNSEEDNTTTEEDPDRERGVENIGRADALESSVYDHGFDKLVLYAEMRADSVVLDWNATDSDAFSRYIVLRSKTDANPYPQKTTPYKTISNQQTVSFIDTDVEKGEDYYYRICFERNDETNPACGNILLIKF